MAIPYETLVEEDLDLGYGATTKSNPRGGTMTGRKVGLHSFTRIVNVASFQPAADGVTDDYGPIKSAISALGGSKGVVLFDNRSYAVGTQLSIPANVTLKGCGVVATQIIGLSGISPLLFSTAADTEFPGGGICDMTIKGSGASVDLLTVQHCWGFKAHNLAFYASSGSVRKCIVLQGSSFEADIRQCRITNYTTYGIELSALGGNQPNSTVIDNNDFAGRNASTSIYVTAAANVKITHNHFEFAATLGGTHIDIDSAGPGTHIHDNNINANVGASVVAQIRVRGSSTYGTITSNRITCDAAVAIDFSGTSRAWTITGNIFDFYTGAVDGIKVNGRPDITIVGNVFEAQNNITGSMVNLNSTPSEVIVSANKMRGLASGTSGTGITLAAGGMGLIVTSNRIYNLVTGITCALDAGTYTNIIADNDLRGNTTAMTVSVLTAVKLRNNLGFLTENSGTATITAAATSVTVTHGLAITPRLQDISVTLTEVATTNDIGTWAVDTVTATTFRIACRAAPGATVATFAWQINGRQ